MHSLTCKLTTNTETWNAPKNLPNVACFSFLAAIIGGEVVVKKVVKLETGTYSVDGYSSILGWQYAPKAIQKVL